MRVKPGSTIDEVFQSLSRSQHRHVEAVLAAREQEPEALRAVQNRAYSAVLRAMESGVPARLLADRLGVSPARIYQMREEAIAYEKAEAGR